MPWGAIASVVGGLIGADASSSAADAQRQGTEQAIAAQQANLAQTREDLAPYRTAGNDALGRLRGLLGLGGSPGGTGGVRNANDTSPVMQKYMDKYGTTDWASVPPEARRQAYSEEETAKTDSSNPGCPARRGERPDTREIIFSQVAF